jgi:hypothetical protein
MDVAARAVVTASVLGDGSLQGNTLKLVHSPAQLDYLEWKCKLIARLMGLRLPEIRLVQHKFPHKIFPSYQALLHAKYFGHLRRWMYIGGRKSTKNVLRFVNTPQALAIWFMDDGNATRRKKFHTDGSLYFLRPRLTLAVHSFTWDEAEDIIRHFRAVFGFSGYVNWERKRNRPGEPQYPRLWFDAEESEKAWKLMLPWMPPVDSMYMKFGHIHQWYSRETTQPTSV